MLRQFAGMSTSPASSPSAPPGLFCPNCGYQLRGLSENRCPECGQAFDPVRLAREQRPPPRLWFERAGPLGIIPAFIATWLMVMFLPGRLARCATVELRLSRALLFGGICLLFVPLALLWGADWQTLVSWSVTVVVFVAVQSIAFTLLEWPRADELTGVYRQWFAIGCYTTAVVCTEVVLGPPYFPLEELRDFVLHGIQPLRPNSDLIEVCVLWVQFLLWTLQLFLCLTARTRLRYSSLPARILAGLLLLCGLAVGSGLAAEYVGDPIYQVIDR